MGLRPEQKSQLLQERRRLLETMGGLLQERQMIQALIKASLAASAIWLHALIQAAQPSTVLALVLLSAHYSAGPTQSVCLYLHEGS